MALVYSWPHLVSENNGGELLYQRQPHRLAEGRRTPRQVQLQHPLGHSARPHFRLQPALCGLLGCRVRQQAESEL